MDDRIVKSVERSGCQQSQGFPPKEVFVRWPFPAWRFWARPVKAQPIEIET
jgi:hypothetical protein